MPKKAGESSSKKTTKKRSAKSTTKRAKSSTAKAKTTKTTTAKPRTPKAKTAKARPAAKATATPHATSGGIRLGVTQIRSGIGHAQTYRATLRAIGLRHHQDRVVVEDTPTMRGMLFKVRHLVRVTEEA